MNKIRLIATAMLSLILSLGFISKASAQLPGNLGGKLDAAKAESGVLEKVQKMKDKLNLNESQVSKITTIFKEAETKIADLKKSGIDAKSLASKTKDINANSDKQVTALLTPAQQAKWQTLKAKL